MAARTNPLPCPRIEFASDFVTRLERFSAELGAARLRSEEFGARGGAQGGHDFLGYRPYHEGDDPRLIDWNAYARLDRTLVRITRREAGERIVVCVDASASMGAGPPGKLQRAAETACALVALALREGAAARIMVAAAGGRRVLDVDKPARLADLLSFFARIQAAGRESVKDCAEGETARGAGTRYLISDFSDLRPEQFNARGHDRGELNLIRILAPHELGLAPDGPVDWFDPERDAHLEIEVDAGTRTRYTLLLSAELERWRVAFATRPGVRHSVHASSDAFEDIVRRSLAR